MVAQINEQRATVIADAVAPAGKPNTGAVLAEGQGAAGMSTAAMHDYRFFFASGGVAPLPNRKVHRAKREVSQPRPILGLDSAASIRDD